MGRLYRLSDIPREIVWARSFHRELERGAQFHVMEEAWLAARVAELDAAAHTDGNFAGIHGAEKTRASHPLKKSGKTSFKRGPRISREWMGNFYWLTLARIMELALFSAGNCADNGMLRQVGDLMFNPRTIMVHIAGQSAPVKKRRHEPMTVQFGDRAGHENVVWWLQRNTINEVKEKPIVPTLMEALRSGGRMTDEYLESVESRSRKIADTVNLVSMCLNGPVTGFDQYLATIDQEERRFLEAGLCRFDLTVFRELESEIWSGTSCGACRSAFIRAEGEAPDHYANFS